MQTVLTTKIALVGKSNVINGHTGNTKLAEFRFTFQDLEIQRIFRNICKQKTFSK